MLFSYGSVNYRRLTVREKTEKILERNIKRTKYYHTLVELFCICSERGLRLIVENPWNEQTYLKANFILPPSYIDKDRTRRGDYYRKPTAYWFVNCRPELGFTYQHDKEERAIMRTKSGAQAGVCGEERSMIHSDYARNFICDNILGVAQLNIDGQLTLF
jgi:hypothetical protein